VTFQPFDVVALARVIEVAAAGRALDREAADALVQRLAVGVEHGRDRSRHRLAGRAGADVVARGGDEDVHHLGRADAVGDRDARALFPRAPGRLGQMLAGGDAIAEGLERGVEFRLRQHRLVRGRRGAEVGDAVLHDRLEQRSGPPCSIVALAAL
jgi:hypothetical protein